jgi:hypothetical protein
MAHLPSFTFILLIIFIAIISFVGVFKLSHDSNENPARITKIDKNARNIEQYIARLEKEVNKISTAIPPSPVTTGKLSMNEEVEKEIEPETDNTIANEPESSSGFISINDRHKAWRDQLFLKLKCLRLKQGTLYLYHVRKAAGTSIRDVMHSMSRTWKVPYFETEGIVLDSHLLEHHKGLTSVLTLREPVNRIMSLYWYEHVGWFDGILKQTQKCKTLVEWVGAWRDGAEWKRNFVLKNPGTVYVEIENYYVKMLTGWRDGDHVIDETDFQRAKVVLEQFDLVFLTDWMGDDTQVDAMNAVFPGRSNIAMGHKIRGDHNAKTRLIPTLAPNEVSQYRWSFAFVNNGVLNVTDCGTRDIKVH